ncbi:MAG: MFS transporter, partial [bacterium]|nr:MFS transporter [bacterium]
YAIVLPVFAPLLFGESTLWIDSYSYSLRCILFAALIFTYMFAHWLGEPCFSAFAMAKGKKPVLILTNSLGILAYVTLSFGFIHENLLLLFIGRFVGGFAAGNCNFVSELSKKLILPKTNKILPLNWASIAGGIGLIFGPLTVGILVDVEIQKWFFNALPFWLIASLTFINILLVSLIPDHEFESTETCYLHSPKSISNFLNFIKKPNLLYVGLSCFFFFLGWFSLLQFTSVYMFLKFDFSESALGFSFAIFGVAWCLALFLNQKNLSLKVLLLLAGLLSFMTPFAHSWRLYFTLVSVIVAISAFIWTNLGLFFKTLNSEDSSENGTIIFIYISCGLAAILATILCGILLMVHFTLIYVASSLCFFLSAAFLFNVRRCA